MSLTSVTSPCDEWKLIALALANQKKEGKPHVLETARVVKSVLSAKVEILSSLDQNIVRKVQEAVMDRRFSSVYRKEITLKFEEMEKRGEALLHGAADELDPSQIDALANLLSEYEKYKNAIEVLHLRSVADVPSIAQCRVRGAEALEHRKVCVKILLPMVQELDKLSTKVTSLLDQRYIKPKKFLEIYAALQKSYKKLSKEFQALQEDPSYAQYAQALYWKGDRLHQVLSDLFVSSKLMNKVWQAKEQLENQVSQYAYAFIRAANMGDLTKAQKIVKKMSEHQLVHHFYTYIDEDQTLRENYFIALNNRVYPSAIDALRRAPKVQHTLNEEFALRSSYYPTYTPPLYDNPSLYKETCYKALDQLRKEGIITDQEASDPGVYHRYYEKAKEGHCAGWRNAFFESIKNHPNVRFSEMIQEIKPERAIYLQLSKYAGERPKGFKKQSLQGNDILIEQCWVHHLEKFCASSSTVGYIEFPTFFTREKSSSLLQSHTFVFWSNQEEYAYLDHGMLVKFPDQDSLFKSLRNLILIGRQSQKWSIPVGALVQIYTKHR